MSAVTMLENDPRNPDSGVGLQQTPAGLVATVNTTRSEGREYLLSPSFLGLLVTQFLTALNDNMFRWLIVPIGMDMVTEQHHSMIVSIGAIMLVLPFLLFAAPAAYLADHFSKRQVIVGCKIAELVFILLGVFGILYGSMWLMFGVLFAMGVQSALLSPSKYGAIPEMVRADRISQANAMVAMTTIVAIVVGTMAGGYLYHWTTPLGQTMWWLWAATMIGVSLVGLVTSLMIRPLHVANPERRFPWDIAGETYRDLKTLVTIRPLFLAAVGTAIFWSLGGLCQLNVVRLVRFDLVLAQKDVGPLLALMAIGVAVGNVLAGVLSAGKIKLGMVPFGAAGIAISGILLSLSPAPAQSAWSAGYLLSGLWLFTLGLSAGMYDVPLQSFLQYRSDDRQRGSILAASNFLTFSGTIIASGLFWLVSGTLGMSGRMVFLLSSLCLLPVVGIALYLLAFDFTHFCCWLLSKLIYKIKIEGFENLPKDGGAMVVANHTSWADGFLLGLACQRHVRMFVFADYFDRWWSRWFARLAKTIPVHPGKRSIVESIRTAREALRGDELVGVFPEGGITRTGDIREFQAGFLSILKDTGRPVVPVYMGGLWGSIFSFEGGKFFWKRPKRWRYPVIIRFGRPIDHPTSPEEVRQEILAMQAEMEGE